MQKTVRVTRTVQVWHRHFQKHYKRPHHDLVHDPTNILAEGDVVTYGPFPAAERAERVAMGKMGRDHGVKYVLREVVTPFGTAVEQRTPRSVGGEPGRWKGTDGEVVKVVRRVRGQGKAKAKGMQGKSNSKVRT